MIEPCYRHARKTWIANCDDCTVWHLAALKSRRADEGRTTTSVDPVPPAGRHSDRGLDANRLIAA